MVDPFLERGSAFNIALGGIYHTYRACDEPYGLSEEIARAIAETSFRRADLEGGPNRRRDSRDQCR